MFCKIYCKGSGSPIVFLHGFLGNSSDWSPVISHLSNRTCIAFDLPGHGKTPWTETNIEELLSRNLPQERVNLIGYSLGGRLALRFALNNPLRIHSLTLLSTHFGLCRDEDKQARFHTDQIWVKKILSLSWDKFLFEWYNQSIFSSLRKKPDLMKQMLSKPKTETPKTLVKALLSWSLSHQDCYRDQLLTFDRPYQILYGENDEKLVQLYASWPKTHCILGAGHILHLESPKEVARTIEELLAE